VQVAASGRGTMVRIDANTGQVLGEYRTAPEGLATNPSRTAIDAFGNTWVGNRDEAGNRAAGPRGSVVKIGVCIGGTRTDANGVPNPNGGYLKPPFAYNTCVDRDGDGLIRTSIGLGDVLAWPNITDGAGGADGIVQDAADEAILVYQRVHGLNVRHISMAAGDTLWVGGYPLVPGDFDLLRNSDGAILQTVFSPPCGGYGGVTDPNGVVWSTTGEGGGTTLMRFDTNTNVITCIDLTQFGPNNTGANHGLNIGPDGTIWVTQFDLDQILRFNPDGTLVPGFPKPTGGDSQDRSCAVSPVDSHVWVDGSLGRRVSHLDANGNFLKAVDLGADGISPRGMAVDANGKVWTTCTFSDTAKRINPVGGGDGLGAVDLTVSLGAGARPYNFSDMTSAVTLPGTDNPGHWQVLYDSAVAGNEYGRISWNADVPAGTALAVEFRAGDDPGTLGGLAYQPAQNGVAFSGVFGRYVDVRVSFTRTPGATVTPVLYDLTIEGLTGGGGGGCTSGKRNPGSLLVFPEFDSRPGSTTLITVTNTDGDFTPVGTLYAGTVQVEFVYVGKYGPGGQPLECLEVNRTHTLSPNDTLSVVARAHNPNQEQGYLYVFAKSPATGQAIVHDHLIGQSIVLDGFSGADDSSEPYVFQGVGAQGDPTDRDGDGVRDLNGLEYTCSPDKLLVPRFLGQDAFPHLGEGFQSELVLVNLTGGTSFTALVDVLLYNDNEEVFSAQTSFECWVKRPLLDISGAFGQSFLAGSNQNPNEILGATTRESGWFRLDGRVASSSAAAFPDPAILALFIEHMPGEHSASDLPFEQGTQTNGDLILIGVLGDSTP
jgi:hypothetical protein